MALPPSATVSTAIHMLHVVPLDVDRGLRAHLLELAHQNAADALGRCHHALGVDGAGHGYRAEEWLPTVDDIARASLRSARLDTEPPTLVEVSQDAIPWLSRAIAELAES